jgi:hypothetical protein
VPPRRPAVRHGLQPVTLSRHGRPLVRRAHGDCSPAPTKSVTGFSRYARPDRTCPFLRAGAPTVSDTCQRPGAP